jgi:hypothetical protein
MSEHLTPIDDDDDPSVGDDKLRGAVAIGREINEPRHRVYYLWSRKRLPGVYRDGRDLVGSKSAIRRAHRNRARAGK